MSYIPSLLTVAGIMVMALISPGPNFIVVTTTAASVSRAAGVMSGVGIAAATLTWTALAVASVHLVAYGSDALHTGLRLCGAVYLVWLGAKMLLGARRPFTPPAQGPALARDAWVALRKGYAVSMTNPKAAAFFGSVFAVTLPRQAPAWVYLAAVAISVILSLSFNCSLALFFSQPKVRAAYLRARMPINVVMGLALVFIGVRLLLH